MRANRISGYVFAVGASLAGCTGTGEVSYGGEVRVASPELVEISPGVQVIADADEPLFYSDGVYWLYRDGYWLRSDDYRRGFVRVQISYVPQRVRLIERPQVYVQYRRRMGRDYQARVREQQLRSRPAPAQPYNPPPNQGAPSTPPPETWQPGEPGINPYPTPPRPTPPITSPKDVHGTPMPPHQVPPVDVDRPMPDDRSNRGGTTSQGTASDRDDRATPPSPPGPPPDNRGKGNDKNDHDKNPKNRR